MIVRILSCNIFEESSNVTANTAAGHQILVEKKSSAALIDNIFKTTFFYNVSR